MTEDFKINFDSIKFSVDEIFHSKEKIFRNILGIDWFVSAKIVKKLELRKFQSLRNVSFISNRIQVTVRYKHLRRKVLARVKIISCPLQFSNTKDMIFDLICEEGNKTISAEVKIDLMDTHMSWVNIEGEFSLHVSPENFFYFKFSSENSLIENGVTESSQNISNELTNDLNELYKKQDFADVDIKCGDEVFKAHKVILSARSPVFAAMFQHEMKESRDSVIDIKDIDSNVLSIFLEFVYCGKIDMLSTENAGNLLSAAEQYQMSGLKKACLAFLHCAMSIDNVLSTVVLADLHDAALKKISIDYVCKEFDHLKTTEEWRRFQKEKPVLANEVLMNIIGFASDHGHKLR